MGRYSLIVVASLFLVLAYFVISMINTGTSTLHRNIDTFEYNEAKNVANSAAQIVINNIINHNTGWDFSKSSYPNGTITNHPMKTYTEWEEIGGRYKISKIVKAGDDLEVTIAGESTNKKQEYEMKLAFRRFSSTGGIFDYSIHSGEITVPSGSIVDSFDPSNPGVFNSNAVVAVTNPEKVSPEERARIHGSLIKSDGLPPVITPPSNTGSTPQILDKNTLPTTGGNYVVNGGINITGSGKHILQGDLTLRVGGDFGFKGSSKLEINGDVVLIIDGDWHSTGSSQLTVNENSSLTVYVNGNITSTGSGEINATGLAANMVFYSAGNQVRFTGGHKDFVGAVYAPNANFITTGATKHYYGALVAKNANINRWQFHYDESLINYGVQQEVGETTSSRYSVLLWE